ncbi:MAG: 16S rRNA (guanine(527)-N(7))-methyltransferase RsmG [Coriobacteriia bacterium]|nr:16S rRNA (guanine(527)-N(7))-methyltransferase RsmG [Coriobacteriia bacterium]
MNDYRERIAAGLAITGVPYTTGQVELLARHLEAVEEANQHFNLTTIKPDQGVELHVLDSAAACAVLQSAPGGRFADIGSGAGFPGIPLSVLSERDVVLVESVRKKGAFLQRVTEELRLQATVHQVRAEELAKAPGMSFAAVTARALSSLPALVELSAPLLQDGGLLICLKGEPTTDELERGSLAAVRCGLQRVSYERVQVPFLDAARTLVVYRKVGRPRIALPRRPGMAQRQPLA